MDDYFKDIYSENEYAAYDPPRGYGTATFDEAKKFYNDLTDTLISIANGQKVELPEGTSIYGLTDFVAFKSIDVGPKALYNLGFRAGRKKSDQHCYIIHPSGRPIMYEYGDLQPNINQLHNQLSNLGK